ncbi:MAG: hypothetical protein ACE141_17465 [Bryobacteraceae bacterium]
MRRKRPPPLTGARAVRREKTYSAESGHAYRYFFCGQRPAGRGVEYVFEASGGREAFRPVSIFLDEAALAVWQSAHERELTAPERYAIAKLSLLRTFDSCPAPAAMPARVTVTPAAVASILETLGRD